MTYRGDDDADEARDGALAKELRAIERVLAEKPALEANRRALLETLRNAEDANGRRRAKVPLPLLARVHVASPCTARWDEMQGDARVRHCGACEKDVYDLSEMTMSEAETLLSREGPMACVRLHRRADGTVITSDCAVGVKKKRRRRWLAAGAAVAGGVLAAAAALATPARTTPCSVTPPDEGLLMGITVLVPPPPATAVIMGDPMPLVGGPMVAPPILIPGSIAAPSPRHPRRSR